MPVRIVDALGVADHLVDGAVTKFSHQLAHLLRDEVHEVDYMRRITVELRAQLRILRGHADGTSVQVANTHHDATQANQRCGRKTKLLSAEQCRYHDIPAGLELAVRLDRDAAAQVVEQQASGGFRQGQVPRARPHA